MVSGSSPRETASVDRPTGPPPNLWAIAARSLAVDAFEPCLVDLEQLKRLARDVDRDGPGMAHLGDIADPPKDAVRHEFPALDATSSAAWSATSTPRMPADRRTMVAPGLLVVASRNVIPKRSGAVS